MIISEISDMAKRQNGSHHGLGMKCQVPVASQLGVLGPYILGSPKACSARALPIKLKKGEEELS